jgi:hypothetical protein
MPAKAIVTFAALSLLGFASAAAQESDYCLQIGMAPNSVNYRECRLLLNQTQSDDPYTAAGARARLAWLQQHVFDKLRRQKEEGPDFSQYGVPAQQGQQPRQRGHDCVMLGDGLGGGIADCD